MANQATNFLENEIYDHVFRNAAYTPPAAIYLALHTADPGEAGSFAAEVSAGGGSAYARQVITVTAPTDGAGENSALIQFPIAATDWGNITHYTITDNATAGAGNALVYGAWDASVTINTGNRFEVAAGGLDLAVL